MLGYLYAIPELLIVSVSLEVALVMASGIYLDLFVFEILEYINIV